MVKLIMDYNKVYKNYIKNQMILLIYLIKHI